MPPPPRGVRAGLQDATIRRRGRQQRVQVRTAVLEASGVLLTQTRRTGVRHGAARSTCVVARGSGAHAEQPYPHAVHLFLFFLSAVSLVLPTQTGFGEQGCLYSVIYALRHAPSVPLSFTEAPSPASLHAPPAVALPPPLIPRSSPLLSYYTQLPAPLRTGAAAVMAAIASADLDAAAQTRGALGLPRGADAAHEAVRSFLGSSDSAVGWAFGDALGALAAAAWRRGGADAAIALIQPAATAAAAASAGAGGAALALASASEAVSPVGWVVPADARDAWGDIGDAFETLAASIGLSGCADVAVAMLKTLEAVAKGAPQGGAIRGLKGNLIGEWRARLAARGDGPWTIHEETSPNLTGGAHSVHLVYQRARLPAVRAA